MFDVMLSKSSGLAFYHLPDKKSGGIGRTAEL